MVGVGEEESSEQREDSTPQTEREEREVEQEEAEEGEAGVVRESEYHAALTKTEVERVGEFRRQLEV
jgi:hypothetical protein